MASGSGSIDIFKTSISLITAHDTEVDFAPTIYTQYNRGEFIEVFDGVWFKTDLSKIATIIPKPVPSFFGLTIFDTATVDVITYTMTGNTGEGFSGVTVEPDHTLRYIDDGQDYYQTGVRNESLNFGWQPRSNTELFTTVQRSDLDSFDYPQFSVRGARKLPLTDDQLCGPESSLSDRSNYNWFFGVNSGLDFNSIETSGTPTTVSGSVISLEGSSVISDTDGGLIFYTDGSTVYTSGHTIMSNGTGLDGNTGSTQSSIIVPKPSTNKYYIFTTNFSSGLNGFKYSLVNMDLQSGVGQVESKNITLINSLLTEKVTAAKHSNDSDYWVVTHTSGDTNFYSYKVSSAGITAPVITSIGSTNNTARGYLKISPDSSKIVNALYDEDIIDIFDFTSSAGTISNFISITGFTYDNGPYGIEYSSDSSKLYVSDGAMGKIYQFDLTYSSATDMSDHSIVVADITGTTIGALQMGPDEKIYVANKDGDTLHVIHHPNGVGVNCNFEEKGIDIVSGTTSQWGLPNLINDNILSCDRYVYLRGLGNDTFNFDYTVNDVTSVVQDKKLNFYTEVYKFDKNNSEFSITPSFISDVIPYDVFSSSTTTNIKIFGIGEGEFLIKGYYEHPMETLVAKQLDRRIDSINTRKIGTEYGLYDSRNDWYFLNMYSADIPILTNNVNNNEVVTSNNANLTVESRFTTSGQTDYQFNSSGDIMVSYNGSVLGKNIDYSLANNTVTLSGEVLENQILTVAYIAGSNNLLYPDTLVVDTINSGVTDTQTENDKIFYNTTKGKYEYYLDVKPSNSTIFTVNGAQLATNIEYYKSNSNSKRIILEVNVKHGDIIQAFYIPTVSAIGQVNTPTPDISWSVISTPTDDFSGLYTLEFVDFDDKSFTTILYSSTTEYVTGVNSYTATVNLTGLNSGDKMLYRVRNEKRYTPIIGELITSNSVSGSNPIQIASNAINSY